MYVRVHRAIYAENSKSPASAHCADIRVYVFALSRDWLAKPLLAQEYGSLNCLKFADLRRVVHEKAFADKLRPAAMTRQDA